MKEIPFYTDLLGLKFLPATVRTHSTMAFAPYSAYFRAEFFTKTYRVTNIAEVDQYMEMFVIPGKLKGSVYHTKR